MIALASLTPSLHAAPPASSALHLNGKLYAAGGPASGEFEFRFQLFTGESGDTVAPKTRTIVTTENVVGGQWQTALDVRRFGGEKTILDELFFPPAQALSILDSVDIPPIGDRAPLEDVTRTSLQQNWRIIEGNWLQISVRRRGAPDFSPLSPRQKMGAVPRASTAFTAEHAVVAGSVAEGGVDRRAIAPGAISGDAIALSGINTEALRDLAVIGSKIAPATVVRSLNGLRDDVTIAAGTGVTLGAQGNTITINAAGGGDAPLPNGNFLGADNDNQFGASASLGVIGGGSANKISDDNSYSALGGGQLNRIYERSNWSFLGGGYNHQIGPDAPSATLGGGYANVIANANSATIAGGYQNVAGGNFATVGGGGSNFAGPGATVAGGGSNRAEGPGSAIGGGNNNAATTSPNATIAGGVGNSLENSGHGFIGGGEQNSMRDAGYSVVSGGLHNMAGAGNSAIIGGEGNRIEAGGDWATVLGGSFNVASGTHSVAAGHRAHAIHSGSFVWNAWPGSPFESRRDLEFAVRAPGGVRFETDGAGLIVDGERVTGGGAGSVDTAQLADRAVTAAKLAVNGNPGNGMLLSFAGGSLVWTAPPQGGGGGGWALGGNAGTDPAANFLGTVDNQPLNFRVNNKVALRIERTRTMTPEGETMESQNTLFNAGQNFILPGLMGVTVAGGAMVEEAPGREQNRAEASFVTISGGSGNTASGQGAVIGGGNRNVASGQHAVIAGGSYNTASNSGSAVLGGGGNYAGVNASVIGGGGNNIIQESRPDGQNHQAFCGIFSGMFNTIQDSTDAFIGGGQGNRIEYANEAVIGGGFQNVSSGRSSVVPGGEDNRALGNFSFAAGHNARANHQGAFVWSDSSAGTHASQRDNEFAVRATGGVRFDTGGAGLIVDGQRVGAGGGQTGTGPIVVSTGGGQTEPQVRLEQTNPDDYVRLMMNTPRSFWTVGTGPNGWFSFYVPGQSPANTTGDNGANRFLITANGEVGVGSDRPFGQFHVRGRGGFDLPQIRATQLNPQDSARFRMETGNQAWDIAANPDGSLRFYSRNQDNVIMDANGGLSARVINQTSDRNAKEEFKAVNGREVLAKVAAMPISEWQFKGEGQGSRHVGPMAQDFHAAFGVGQDDRHIATVDADGVALAAIQGLHAEAQEKDARIRALEEQVRRLDEMVRKLAEAR